jgi:PhoPQ-activated pathogenicity-related protein
MDETDELFDYIDRPDAAFHWRHLGSREQSGVTIAQLHLTSQIWQHITWTHTIELYIPAQSRNPDIALLDIATPPGEGQAEIGTLLASHTGLTCAFLSDIPNQPLYDDLVEDALIAYTFVRYLDTGDAAWPLLFPMVKSAVRAMDAIQQFMITRTGVAPGGFVVTGASKRGWTTWLTAAVDPRIAGIAPMVYDNLNLMAQMPHQVEVFEGYSDKISDYTEQGLPQRMQTPDGLRLTRMIDPYTYCDRLTMPKLIINGSNDPYWATDAINLYWHDLPGVKHLLDIPNVGHSLNDHERLYSALYAFLTSIADDRSLPHLDWHTENRPDEVVVTVVADEPAFAARCWVAYAFGRDFRMAPWNEIEMVTGESITPDSVVYRATVPRPASGYMALYGELQFSREGLLFPLSTPVHISGNSSA